MFKSQNFCHIASNNRNLVKVGVFTYRTTDSLETVLTSGYFNERIIDINLHDLIIHEKISAIDSTVVERNILCVVERTLDNVGTTLIKSDWEKDVEQSIEDIEEIIENLDNTYLKLDGTNIMTGPLKMRASISFQCAIAPFWDGVGFYKLNSDDSLTLIASIETPDGFVPWTTNTYNIGSSLKKWKNLYLAGKAYVSTINNGGDLVVPAVSGTLATKEDVDLAANSGDQLYSTGVWYAKMYAGTTPPASAEIEGRNYADFSQTDGSGNPVIKVYTYTSGSWTLTDTIVPPAEYNGYMTITSKIWDISEQAGQQGGKVLWSHNQKTFTPYPQIISFENAALTGVSTAPTPTDDSPDNQIATKEYVDNATPSGSYHPDLFDVKWADHICNDVQWLRADTFSWQSGAVYQVAYQHLADDIDGKTLQSETINGTTIQFYLADDGHKICPASEESNVSAIYNATGVAWYYIIDTANTRFKLPRTQFAFTGIRNGVGAFVDAGLPNITGNLTSVYGGGYIAADGALKVNGSAGTGGGSSGSNPQKINLDASRSSSIYGNSDTVQPKATEMYLYFYVGNFTQTALENTAGITTEEMNNKADKDDAVGYCSFNTGTRVQISTTEQTAAKNGWLIGYIAFSGSNVNCDIFVNGITVGRFGWTSSANWFGASVQIPIKAGQTFKYSTTGTTQDNKMYFYPND